MCPTRWACKCGIKESSLGIISTELTLKNVGLDEKRQEEDLDKERSLLLPQPCGLGAGSAGY